MMDCRVTPLRGGPGNDAVGATPRLLPHECAGCREKKNGVGVDEFFRSLACDDARRPGLPDAGRALDMPPGLSSAGRVGHEIG